MNGLDSEKKKKKKGVHEFVFTQPEPKPTPSEPITPSATRSKWLQGVLLAKSVSSSEIGLGASGFKKFKLSSGCISYDDPPYPLASVVRQEALNAAFTVKVLLTNKKFNQVQLLIT